MSSAADAVLFDLDGTLLDTAPDLVAALNRLRAEQGQPPLDYALARTTVSHGAGRMVWLGFAESEGERFELLRNRLLEIYRENLAVNTALFDGFAPVLDVLERNGLPWGVVTNKPAFLTEPLLLALGLHARAACVVSGDTLPQRKPHPAPLLLAAARMNVAPERCLYVGDAERDVQAARAAGMRSLVARFGYLGPQDDPQSWNPDACIDTPAEILTWLKLA